MRFISKGSWFDENTECLLIYDNENGSGIFEGIRTCKGSSLESRSYINGEKYLDQKDCLFEDFIIFDED
jgi:hypothetical protein